jgi:hypothetical protein
MTELQLWQSIASLNCVEGLTAAVNDAREYGGDWECVFRSKTKCEIVRLGRYWDSDNGYEQRAAALLIVDAIEAAKLGRFHRIGRRWHFEFALGVNRWIYSEDLDVPDDQYEHLSLLTVIERVLREIKEGK